MEGIRASLPSGYEAILMSQTGQWTHTHWSSRLFALGATGGRRRHRHECSCCDSPFKLTASILVAVGLVSSHCSVTFPQSAARTHTHAKWYPPEALIVSLDYLYEPYFPYSKTKTPVCPLLFSKLSKTYFLLHFMHNIRRLNSELIWMCHFQNFPWNNLCFIHSFDWPLNSFL